MGLGQGSENGELRWNQADSGSSRTGHAHPRRALSKAYQLEAAGMRGRLQQRVSRAPVSRVRSRR